MKAIGAVLDWLISRSAMVNMTNVRQQVTLALVVGTGLVYLGLAIKWAIQPDVRGEWVPDLEWLGFLTLMSGLDATQYFAKRTTDANYVGAKVGATAKPPEPPV